MTAKIVDCYHYAMPQLHLNPSKSLHIVLPGGQETGGHGEDCRGARREQHNNTSPSSQLWSNLPAYCSDCSEPAAGKWFRTQPAFPSLPSSAVPYISKLAPTHFYGEVTGVSLKAQKKKEFRQKYVRCYTHNKASEAPATELSRQGKQGRTKYKTILKKVHRLVYRTDNYCCSSSRRQHTIYSKKWFTFFWGINNALLFLLKLIKTNHEKLKYNWSFTHTESQILNQFLCRNNSNFNHTNGLLIGLPIIQWTFRDMFLACGKCIVIWIKSLIKVCSLQLQETMMLSNLMSY